MKEHLKLLAYAVFTFCIMIPISLTAARPEIPTILYGTSNPSGEGKSDEDPKYRRVPPRPVECSISQETGLSIPNVDNSEIVLYEVYDEYEACIATFDAEDEFISFIYSYEGGVIIKVYTENYVYSGYIPE